MNQDLDPNKYHTLNPTQKRNYIILFLLLAVLTIPTLGFFYYKFALNRPAQTAKEITFEIERGQGVREIANNLYQAEALNSEALFVIYVMTNNLDKNIQAGTYKIKAGTSVVELAELIQHGTNDTKITFLEGWRAEEFAREAAQKLENINYQKFLDLVHKEDSLEGRLFPDTYFISQEITEEDLVELLHTTFEKRVSELDTSSLTANGLTTDQAFVLASLVERESFSDDEKPVIAGILIKRLKEGEILGVDATTQYAVAELKFCGYSNDECPTDEQVLNINWWPNNLTAQDLESTSAYNTRENGGLPPTPISSFSISSLEAVLNPENTSYGYYLHDNEGTIRYATTLEEHNANVNQYLQ